MKLSGLRFGAVGLRGRAGLFIRDEAGQDLIEYALIATLLALGAIVSMRSVSVKLGASFANIAASVAAS